MRWAEVAFFSFLLCFPSYSIFFFLILCSTVLNNPLHSAVGGVGGDRPVLDYFDESTKKSAALSIFVTKINFKGQNEEDIFWIADVLDASADGGGGTIA